MTPLRSRRHRRRLAWTRARHAAFVLFACVGLLVPLFGDPRSTPVTHPLWARLLLRALEMEPAVRASATASQVFATLAWRDSLSYSADRYWSASEARVEGTADTALVRAGRRPAEVSYALAVVQPGRYQLRAQLAGASAAPATAELVPLGGGRALESFSLALPGEAAWVFAGAPRLAAGAYAARFLLPPGCALGRVEIAPPCLRPIEPPGGWQPEAATTRDDLAVTAIQAMDREDELPPAASAVEVDADAFRVEAPAAPPAEAPVLTLRAGRGGLRAVVSVELPESGLYVLSGLVAPGAGQRWLIDSCRSAALCPGGSAATWRTLASQVFEAGRHTLEVTLGEGASLQSVRLELKKSRPADYAAALERLGFRAGEAGPVSRSIALDAARFVREQRRAALAAECLSPMPVEEPGPVTTVAAGQPAPPVPPPPDNGAPVPPPSDVPLLPPQEVATPTRPGGGA